MFTVDPSSNEPIMLLNKQIGKTCLESGEWDGIPYVDGAEFQEELMWLDTMGKKRIQVWINSPGGSVMQAMNIFSAILKSTTPVDTINTGVCASAAGLVFMAGRKRTMADYAQFMMHPVSGADEDAQGAAAFTDSCTKMLSSKSNLSPDTISFMMASTTWLSASECLAKGICTDIEVTKDANKKGMPAGNVTAMLEFSNNILTQTINNLKPQVMTLDKVTNKLGLVAGANEDAILNAVNSISEARQAAETALTEAQQQVADLQAQLDAANASLQEAQDAAAAAQAEVDEIAAETAATEMVNSYKPRIGEAKETLDKWVAKAKVDFEGTKELLESLPLNKINNRIPDGAAPRKVTTESRMAEIRAKHGQA